MDEAGTVHLTSTVLELLDSRELEAVLAHEVAHLARRDAAAMEVCSGPSRVLLGFAALAAPLWRLKSSLIEADPLHGTVVAVLMWVLAALALPPAYVLGWFSRLSVLGMSRSREFAADAAAAALTGRPSALASALMKLEQQRDWTPRTDLRQNAVLCILDTKRSPLGRLFSTHPPTAERVKRLEALEARLHAPT